MTYTLLLDVLAEEADQEATGSSPSKKDVFKYLKSAAACRQGLVVQVLIGLQLMSCARQLMQTIRDTSREWFRAQVDSQLGAASDEEAQQQKLILERKNETELKHIEEELREIESKQRSFFSSKLEKNLQRVHESKLTQTVSQFCDFQSLMAAIAKGLRTHYQMQTLNLTGILEDQQRKYLAAFRENKVF